MLIHTKTQLKDRVADYIAKHKGVSIHIDELFKLDEKGLTGGNIKSVLKFRGTRQEQVFNLGDLKLNIPNANWSDLTLTIIENHKINIRIGTYSKTFEYSDIPFFTNSRMNMPKSCWYTLIRYEREKFDCYRFDIPKKGGIVAKGRGVFRTLKEALEYKE